MQLVGLIFAGIAGVFHVLFFYLESLAWGSSKVNKIFNQTPETAEITRLLAYNQGFYNLFLAIGTFVGIYLYTSGNKAVGLTAIIFGCGCMFAASLVLFYSKPKAIAGVLAQGIPPLVAIVLLWLSR